MVSTVPAHESSVQVENGDLAAVLSQPRAHRGSDSTRPTGHDRRALRVGHVLLLGR